MVSFTKILPDYTAARRSNVLTGTPSELSSRCNFKFYMFLNFCSEFSVFIRRSFRAFPPSYD